MGTRRGHIFVLLFVLALIGLSLLVVATKETHLGLPMPEGAASLF